MTPRDFMRAVLPPSGFYCIAELTKKKEHVYVESLEEAEEAATKFEAAGKDPYFALAAFNESGSREADNAREFRALWLDVDAGRKSAHKTKKDALVGLQRFLSDSELDTLGSPLIVDSGNGLHVYWPLEAPVPVGVWRPVAEQLKRLCALYGFAIDNTATADAARVLRVPGTTNRKYADPKPVEILVTGSVFAFEALQKAIAEKLPEDAQPTQPLDLEGERPKNAPTTTQLKLFENSEVRFKDILKKTADGQGCKQLEHYIEHADEDGMEPLWRGLLSIAKVCTDAEKAARNLSAMHPYTTQRMEQKLREIKGPYPCAKFDSENPGVCQTCVHWGKITNPLALGRYTPVVTQQVELTVPVAKEDGTEEDVAYTRPAAPKGFGYGKSGGVYRERVEDGLKVQVPILPYDLFVVDILNVNGAHSAHMVALRPDGPKSITIPTKALVSKDDTVKSLAEQNIVASFGAGNDKNLFDYVRAAFEDANLRHGVSSIPSQYGWQKDGSFVYSGRVFLPNGTERTTPMPGLENLAAATRAEGTLDGWRVVIDLLVNRGMYDVLAMAMVGFGAPVMCFTGMRGLTFHAGNKESGTGKSLALSIAASIWGHPVDYRTGKSTSPVAMQQRAGSLNSLPLLSDEMTARARVDPEWFPSFVFDFSEGRGKERMEASLNRERVNTTTWSSLAMFTSNVRMLDFMSGVRKTSSEGELRRFLEWSPSKQIVWTPEEEQVLQSLQSNYGVAGERYARWLAANRDTARKVTEKVRTKLFADFGATNDERFWIAGVAAVLAGSVLAGPKYANVVAVPVEKIKDAFFEIVKTARKAIQSGRMTSEDILNDYIRDYYGQFVVVKRANGNILAALANGEMIDNSITRNKVMGRVEHDMTPGVIDFYIEETSLKKHCAVFGFGYEEFKEELKQTHVVQQRRMDMLSGTRGPTMRVNAVKISKKE